MTKHSEHQCPACGEGRLHREGYLLAVEYRGHKGQIQQQKLRCDHCHADLYDEECGRVNRRALVSFQKQIDGVATGEQIRALRRRLGLTSEEAGVLLGGGPRAFSKYENEEIVPRGAMRTLVNYLMKHPERIDDILEANGRPRRRTPAVRAKVANQPHEPRRAMVQHLAGVKLEIEDPFVAIYAGSIAAAKWSTVFAHTASLDPVEILELTPVIPAHSTLHGRRALPIFLTYPTRTDTSEPVVASEDHVIANWALHRGART